MAEAYPFPFTDAILEEFPASEQSPPIWEHLLPEWTPDTGVPLHLAGMKEVLYMGRVILWQIINQRIPEVEDDLGRYYLEMTTNMVSTCLDKLDELVKLGQMTSHVDPVIVKAVNSNGDGEPIPVPAATEYIESLDVIRKKLRHRASFRVVPQEMREMWKVDPNVNENTKIDDFASFTVPLTESQFPKFLIALSAWLDCYEALPWCFKAIMRDLPRSREQGESFSAILSEAFEGLQSLYALVVDDIRGKFVDLAHLKAPQSQGAAAQETPLDLSATG